MLILRPPLCALHLSAVHTGYALAAVPVCRSGVIDALELQQRCARVGVALSTDRERVLEVYGTMVHTLAGSCGLLATLRNCVSAMSALTKCAFPSHKGGGTSQTWRTIWISGLCGKGIETVGRGVAAG